MPSNSATVYSRKWPGLTESSRRGSNGLRPVSRRTRLPMRAAFGVWRTSQPPGRRAASRRRSTCIGGNREMFDHLGADNDVVAAQVGPKFLSFGVLQVELNVPFS